MAMDFANIDIKELACFIYETLKQSGIDAVLVGGACVTIYSQNRYQSYDLDFVTYKELKVVEKALEKHGFKRTGRCFVHEHCPYLIDFVNPPIAIGNESIRHFETLKQQLELSNYSHLPTVLKTASLPSFTGMTPRLSSKLC